MGNNEPMEDRAGERPSRRALRRFVLPLLVGLIAGIAALGLVPAANGSLGPATVAIKAKPARPDTVLNVPPLGTISAHTHSAPVSLDLSFRTIDFERLGPLATTAAGRVDLVRQMSDDLRALAVRSALQFVLGGMLIGALVTALLWQRRWLQIALGATGGAAGVAVLIGIAAITFDPSGFEEPRYSGTLARAPVVIETLRETPAVLDTLRTRYENASRRLSDLLVLVARPDADPRIDTTAVLHIGDIHANPLGLEIAQELATAFAVDAVIDTGDLASSTIDTGSLSELAGPIDRRLAAMIEDIGVPYYFVRGNHDSPQLLSALRAADNVTLFGDEVQDVAGLQVLGWDDPTFTTDSRVTPEQKADARREAAPEVAAVLEAEAPDVLAVHDARLAGDALGSVPVVIAGHTHDRGFEQTEGTTLLTVGTTGATGVSSLTLDTEEDYEAEVLYFAADGAIVAVDYITFRGSDDFEVERTTLEEIAPEEEGA